MGRAGVSWAADTGERESEVGEAGEADRRRGLHHLLQQQQQDLAAASMRLHAGRAVEWLYARPSVVAVCVHACVCVGQNHQSGVGGGSPACV